MTVLFRSAAGPLEGFTRATFRVAINDDGVGELTAPGDVIDSISGSIECAVDGVTVFRWTPEERRVESRDTELVTLSGRGRAAALERAIVLPVGYPAFTTRTRTETGAPLAVFSVLLAEAQARGRVTDLNPTWTATEDSKGAPWTETVQVQFEPGNDLRAVLSNLTEVEGAEWIVRANGDIDVAPQIGDDRSSEVVLFYGYDQVSRNRRSSGRDQRQTVFIEASTGVSESVNGADVDAGEIWLEAQDYADPVSRQTLADKVALKLSLPNEEVNVRVAADVGAFTRFGPGDIVSVDSGSGPFEQVRVVGLAVDVTPDRERFEATLVSEVALFQQKIERAIEAQADVKLAASPSIQRRHGLVTADKFLSGAVGTDVAISSENYTPGVDGWAILGNGNAEFNDAVFRGDLESVNYDPGVAGWQILNNGQAEFNDTVTINGTINATDGSIGGFTIAADKLQGNLGTGNGEIAGGLLAGCRLLGGSLQIGGASGVNANGSDGFWSGAATFGNAPFSVDLDGNLVATNATISGTVDAATITGSTITGSSISAAGGAVNIGLLGIELVTGGFALNAIRWTNGGVLWSNNPGQFIVSAGSISNLSTGTLDVRAGTISLSGGIQLSGDALLLAGRTFEIGTNSLIFARNSDTNPAATTPRAVLNWSTPRITVISQNDAPAVFGRNSNGTVVNFRRSGSTVGNITVTATNTSYLTSSDVRAKTDIENMAGSLDTLQALRPVTYRWKIEPDGEPVHGLIAHELQAVVPSAVFGEPDAVDEDGEPLLQQVDYSKLVPLLIGAVQELADRVDSIEQGE